MYTKWIYRSLKAKTLNMHRDTTVIRSISANISSLGGGGSDGGVGGWQGT